jgi:hypothetical protein
MKKRLLLSLIFLIAASPTLAMEQIKALPAGTNSVILRFPLYDAAAPEDCATDVTISTSGLQINVSSDVSNGYIDQFQQSDSTLEGITTIGTFSDPSATKARFEIIATGACTYELQLPNSIYDTASANIITIEITDASTQIIDAVYWVDMTPVSAASLVDDIMDEEIVSAHNTANTLGGQAGVLLDAINATGAAYTFVSDVADSGTTTTLVDADGLTGYADNFFNNYTAVIIEFAGGSEVRCVRGFTDSSDTLSWYPATSGNVDTETYRIVSAPECRNFP